MRYVLIPCKRIINFTNAYGLKNTLRSIIQNKCKWGDKARGLNPHLRVLGVEIQKPNNWLKGERR
jgi:hypothetical protein